MEEESASRYPVSQAKMSKVPSWISLGFVLGALFAWALFKPEAPPTPSGAPPAAAPPAPRVPQPTKLTTVEAVFEIWREHAVWDNDITEVAFWNQGTEEFSEFYEIRRIDGAFYFRSLPQLTRRIINHGKPLPSECPLQFTETEEQYREWRDYGRSERSERPPRPLFAPVELPRPKAQEIPRQAPAVEIPKP